MSDSPRNQADRIRIALRRLSKLIEASEKTDAASPYWPLFDRLEEELEKAEARSRRLAAHLNEGQTASLRSTERSQERSEA